MQTTTVPRSIIAAFVLVLVSTPGLTAQESGPRNLVETPSIEGPVAPNGLPRKWIGSSSPEGAYVFRSDDSARTGKKSLLIDGDGQFGVVSTNRIRIDSGKRYRARGWIKIVGDETAAADVKFHYFDSDQQYLGQTRIPFVSPPTDDWVQIEVIDRIAEFPEAEWIQVAVALAGNGKAWFDDLELTAHARDSVSKQFEFSPERRVLDRWTGKWIADVNMNPAAWTPRGMKMTETKSCEWMVKNSFLQETGRKVSGGNGEHQAVMGFDMRRRVYRIWLFDSNGIATTADGTWDSKSQTMTWTSDLGIGAQMKATHRFINKDTYLYSFHIKSKNGDVLMDGSAMHRRTK